MGRWNNVLTTPSAARRNRDTPVNASDLRRVIIRTHLSPVTVTDNSVNWQKNEIRGQLRPAVVKPVIAAKNMDRHIAETPSSLRAVAVLVSADGCVVEVFSTGWTISHDRYKYLRYVQ